DLAVKCPEQTLVPPMSLAGRPGLDFAPGNRDPHEVRAEPHGRRPYSGGVGGDEIEASKDDRSPLGVHEAAVRACHPRRGDLSSAARPCQGADEHQSEKAGRQRTTGGRPQRAVPSGLAHLSAPPPWLAAALPRYPY